MDCLFPWLAIGGFEFDRVIIVFGCSMLGKVVLCASLIRKMETPILSLIVKNLITMNGTSWPLELMSRDIHCLLLIFVRELVNIKVTGAPVDLL